MLVLMTINTEILPVRAVRGVVPGISVFMVYSEKIPVFGIELSPAFGAYKAMDFQGLFPVIAGSSASLFQFPYDFSSGFASCRLLRQRFSEFYPLSASQENLPHNYYSNLSASIGLRSDALYAG